MSSARGVVAVLLLFASPAVIVQADPPQQPPLESRAEKVANDTVDRLSPLANGPASEVFWRLASFANLTLMNETVTPVSPDWLTSAPLALQPALAIIWGGMEKATDKLNLALQELNTTERTRFLELATLILPTLRNITGNGTADDQAIRNEFTSLGSQLNVTLLGEGQLALLRAVEQAIPLLDDRGSVPSDQTCAVGTVVFEIPGCLVVVGGRDPNIYNRSVGLLVDMGGSDTYKNNSGGASTLENRPVAVLIDHGYDDDTYLNVSYDQRAVQGSGCLGIGLLVDMGGSDFYQANTTTPCSAQVVTPIVIPGGVAAQASGLGGAGVLWDRCPTGGTCNDDYLSRRYATGVGIYGFGLLLDENGHDEYVTSYSYASEGSQGTACGAGFGALVDRFVDAGNDSYRAAVDDMQGMGCLAAAGVLWDQAGSDNYTIEAGLGIFGSQNLLVGGWSQGFGELGGIGVLIVFAGQDTYSIPPISGEAFSSVISQGAGNGGVGLLLDEGLTTDMFYGASYIQGWGIAGGLGILRDRGGNDDYEASIRCQGSGGEPNSPLYPGEGALLDDAGTSDSYVCSEPAFVCENPAQATSRANAQKWCSGNLGVGLDRQ